jgi:HK97 family phage prohead protease
MKKDQKINKTFINSELVEVKSEMREGIEVGIVKGYIATWDLDRGNGYVRDQFLRGAFKKSIRDHKSKNRSLRLKDHHGRTIGGFPSKTLKEDDRGLYGIGEINLEVQQGKEAYSLAKQGVLTDFSVGFSISKSNRDEQKDVRIITEAVLWEGSIVDEPMNPFANITEVKNEDGNMTEVTEEEVKKMTKRDLEEALRSGREFTKQAAITVASLFEGVAPPETEEERLLREEQLILQDEKDFEDFADSLKSFAKPFE